MYQNANDPRSVYLQSLNRDHLLGLSADVSEKVWCVCFDFVNILVNFCVYSLFSILLSMFKMEERFTNDWNLKKLHSNYIVERTRCTKKKQQLNVIRVLLPLKEFHFGVYLLLFSCVVLNKFVGNIYMINHSDHGALSVNHSLIEFSQTLCSYSTRKFSYFNF